MQSVTRLKFLDVTTWLLRRVFFYLPQWMDVKHGGLKLCQLDGCDAHRPDVAQFVITTFNLHRCHLWRHPVVDMGTGEFNRH